MHVWRGRPRPRPLTLNLPDFEFAPDFELAFDFHFTLDLGFALGRKVKSGGRGRPPHTHNQFPHLVWGVPRCKLPRNAIFAAVLDPGISTVSRPYRHGLRFRLQRASQAGGHHRDRPVSRRLSGALSRPVGRRRVPPPARPWRRLYGLQLRLRQHPHRARACDPADRGVFERPRHHGQRMVGPAEEAAGDLRSRTARRNWSASAAVRTGASPHNLLADTLGDELKLATQGKARVFGVALKDRASAILPAGFAGDGAYWIDQKTGTWITSTYYRERAPQVGAGFQRQQAGREVSEPGMERQQRRSSAHDQAQ